MSGSSRDGSKAVLRRFGKMVHEGWFLEGDEESSQARRALIVHNITANLIANLIGGNFLTGFVLLLKADDSFVGLVTTLTFAGNLLQLLSPYLLERVERRKPLLIGVRCLMHLVNIVFIGLIPFAPVSAQARLAVLAFSVFLVNTMNAFLGPGLSIWHVAHIPPLVRVQYFSTVTMFNGVGVALVNLFASLAVDRMRAAGQELWGLEILRLLALMIAALDIAMLVRIKELPHTGPLRRVRLRDLFVQPWRDKPYLRSVLAVVMWSLLVNMPGQYYTVYLLRELKVSYAYINAVALINVPILILMTPVWRAIYLRWNWMRPLALAVMLLSPHYFLLAFASGRLAFLYVIGMVWWFVFVNGINLAFANVIYLNLPQENQTLYVSFYSTANFLAAVATSMLARTFVTGLGGLRFTLLGVSFGEKQLLMLIVGISMLGAGLVIRALGRRNQAQGLQY